MADEIKSALSPEEWTDRMAYTAGTETLAVLVESGVRFVVVGAWGGPGPITREWAMSRIGEASSYDRQHALAALALYGQPFGFTREDVELLRRLVRANVDFAPDDDPTRIIDLEVTEAEYQRITSLADRLAALLPPEEVQS